MGYWNKKINVSKEAAKQQVAIINSFSPEKRLKIALDFANMGVNGTIDWIKLKNPGFSDLETRLEFVRLQFENKEISETHWFHFKKIMEKKFAKIGLPGLEK